jgi:glutamate-1-semialdehyde 2,1-aminomutase
MSYNINNAEAEQGPPILGGEARALPWTMSDLIERNKRYLPGGVSSINRLTDPLIAFARAEGAYLWDVEGTRYIDYHAAFAPYFLGHNFPQVNAAAVHALGSGDSLFGSGPSILEGDLAELLCERIGPVEKVALLNTGSEATALAIRLSRAVTERSHVIVMQGSYNGNHDEVACNVFNTIDEIGPRVQPGEYPLCPLGAGTNIEAARLIHPINFNDLESVRYVCKRYPVAALITEPVLQNIGVVHPNDGYLQGLRDLADEFGFVLILDEVKTGFRHAVGGYSELANVRPDLVVYGKAIANGFPLAVVGGASKYMDHIVASDPSKRPFVAGTYNGHPVAVAAAIETVKYLIANEATLYPAIEALGAKMQRGMEDAIRKHGVTATVVRQGSALSVYFMARPPHDFHDMVENHDFEMDVAVRRALISLGVYVVPVATKQWSISCAHTEADIDFTLEKFEEALAACCG